MCSHRSPRGDGRCLKEESIPLFVLFVLFGQAKRTLKEKKHNVTFPLSYFSMTKSTKSHQRERSPLFENSSRVHELVARSSAWQVRAANSRAKADSLALSAVSAIPRVRTYHTKKPSRFVHALSARPHNRVGGRGWSKCADGMESVFFILSVCYALGFVRRAVACCRRRDIKQLFFYRAFE